MKDISNTTPAALTARRLWPGQKPLFSLYRSASLIALWAAAALIILNLAVAVNLHLSPPFLVGDSVISCFLLLPILLLWRSPFAPAARHTAISPTTDLAALLERQVIPLDTNEIYSFLKGKVVLVTGAAGSIGSELCQQLLDSDLETLIALDTNETGLFDLVEHLRLTGHPHHKRIQPFIGDITDIRRICRLLSEKKPHTLFHVAAYKHVPLLEQHPDLAIRTNALATYDLCHYAQEYGVEQFVYVSTDKAAHPVSVMGATKRLAEMVVQAMATSNQGTTRFCAVRFGNVIGSRGSVVPLFERQIAQGGPITVTDPEATRYFMTIPEACGLVMLAHTLSTQGELYLLDMGEPVRIMDIARRMADQHGLRLGRDIRLVYTGLRPGERLHEVLNSSSEQLLPTSHSKIMQVSRAEGIPTISTIIEWLEIFENDLEHGNMLQLRKHLFSCVQEEKLVVSGQTC